MDEVCVKSMVKRLKVTGRILVYCWPNVIPQILKQIPPYYHTYTRQQKHFHIAIK